MTSHSQRNQKPRRPIVFWFFLIAAAPLTILLIAYASGYRFDTTTQQIVNRSVLSIEVTPKTVDVYVDGTFIDHTPLIYSNVDPGLHTVELQHEGYLPWEKELLFEAGRAANFPEVILFRDTTATPVDATLRESPYTLQPLPEELWPTYREFGFRIPKRLRYSDGPQHDIVVDPQAGVSFIVDSIEQFSDAQMISAPITAVDWLSGSTGLYVTGTELWIYESEEPRLVTRTSTPIDEAIWHPDGGYIFTASDSGITAIELDGRDVRQTWILDDSTTHSQLQMQGDDRLLWKVSDGQTVYERVLFDK